MADFVQPSSSSFSTYTEDGGVVADITYTLTWKRNLGKDMTKAFLQAQKVLDSEVLKDCAPLMPLRKNKLIPSGILGTTLGSGVIQWTVPYAKFQYYDTEDTREYDPRRGGHWFERAKATYGEDWIEKTKAKIGEFYG